MGYEKLLPSGGKIALKTEGEELKESRNVKCFCYIRIFMAGLEEDDKVKVQLRLRDLQLRIWEIIGCFII